MDEKELENLDIPEELYAPMGNVTFEKPKQKKEVEPEILSYQNVKLEYSEKPFDRKRFIKRVVTLIVFILIILLGCLYITNKKIVLKKAVSQTTSKLETIVVELKNNKLTHFSEEDPFKTGLLVSFDTKYDKNNVTAEEKKFFDTLNDINLLEDVQLDYPNKQFTHAFKANYANNSIIDIRGNGSENTINYKILEIIGKYIEYPLESIDFFYRDSETDNKLLNKLGKSFAKPIFSDIKERDLVRSKTKIQIGNNQYNVKNISLTLNEEEIKEIFNKICKNSKKEISEYFDLKEEEYKKYVAEFEKTINEMNIKSIRFDVYSKGLENKILGIKFSVVLDKTYTFTYLEDGENLSLLIENNENTLLALEKTNITENNADIKLNLFNTNIDIKQSVKNGNLSYEYTSNTKNNEYLTGNLILHDEETKRSKDGYIRFLIKKTDKNQKEIFNIQTVLNYNVETLEKIELYDDTNKIKIEELDNNTKNEIKKKLEKAKYFSLVKRNIDAYINSKK